MTTCPDWSGYVPVAGGAPRVGCIRSRTCREIGVEFVQPPERSMDAPDSRQLTSLLASDLAWLEDHCRRQPALAREAGQLRLAAALVRNVVGPFLDGGPTTPLHVAVVGGAGAGKSTVVNFLVGAQVADANPQAGYTRHPTAYLPANASSGWTGHLGF